MRIVIIAGPICSGKDYYASQLQSDGIVENHISIGNIVRKITGTSNRVHDRDLDREIIKVLMEELENSFKAELNVVVTGVRQLSIVRAIEAFAANNNATVTLVWLTGNSTIFAQRYERRKTSKERIEGTSYITAYSRDMELGLAEVKEYFQQSNNTQVINTTL